MRTANLAIVFTAIQDFSERTGRQSLEENQRLLHTHSELVGPLFRAFGGRILKAIGDTLLVTFDSPTQALLGALAVQDRLWLHNREAPAAERLVLRVAVNVGEVRLETGDVFGEPVNVAARVLGVAEPGEVFFTEAVFLAMARAEVPAEELGAYSFKGIPEKVRVYRVPHAAEHTLAQGEAREERMAQAGGGPGEVLAGGAEAGWAVVPPFGHRGLARVPSDTAWLSSALVAEALSEGLADLRSRAGELSGRVATLRARAAPVVDGLSARGEALGQGAREQLGEWGAEGSVRVAGWVARARERLALLRAEGAPDARPLLRGAGVVCLLALAWWFLGRDPVLGAIRAVEGTEGEERAHRTEEARRRIAAVGNEGREAYYAGRLEEALGHGERAASRYRVAVRAGEGEAEGRLIELLEAEDCRTRAAAARTLGDLRLASARGALEVLAEEGGPGEDDLPLFGCNSRRAAQSALERL